MQLVQGPAQPGVPGKLEPAVEARPVAPAPLARLQEGAAPACIVTRVAEGQALCQQAAGACPAEYMLLGIKGVGNQRCCQQPAARAPSKDIWMSCLESFRGSAGQVIPLQHAHLCHRCRSGCTVQRGSCDQQDRGR